MLISIITILSLLLILFRVLRGESIRDIHREIMELKKATDVSHFFWKSLKIVFSFKGLGIKRKKKENEN